MYHYYNESNQKIYDNRFDALVDMNNDQPVKMYWRDKEFDKLDWKTEPSETLKQLYKQRAEQIRTDYDYVVLCYSGGIDSTNVLESFYYNNIHIDEIICVGSFSQDIDKDIDLNHNKDIYSNVIPNLQRFNLPNTKKTFIDYTTYFTNLNNFSLYKQYGSDYYKYIGVYPSVTYLFWYDLGKFLNTKKKTAIVFGNEKPFLKKDLDGNFFTHHVDSSIATYSQFNFDNTFKLNFYSDPEAGDIMRKQLHIIKNFYIRCVAVEQNMSEETFISNYIDIIHKLIYDIKNPLIYISKKNSCMFLSGRDMYIKDNKNSDIYKLYAETIKKISKCVNLNQRHSIRSKNYYIT